MRRNPSYSPKSERKGALVPTIRAARAAVRSAKHREGLETEAQKRQRALDLAGNVEPPYDLAAQAITRSILQEAPSRQQGFGFGQTRKNPRGAPVPSWFTRAVRAGAIPYAMGEHGQFTAVSRDGRRAITDADAPMGKLDRCKGEMSEGAFDVQQTLSSMGETAALAWLRGKPARQSNPAKAGSAHRREIKKVAGRHANLIGVASKLGGYADVQRYNAAWLAWYERLSAADRQVADRAYHRAMQEFSRGYHEGLGAKNNPASLFMSWGGGGVGNSFSWRSPDGRLGMDVLPNGTRTVYVRGSTPRLFVHKNGKALPWTYASHDTATFKTERSAYNAVQKFYATPAQANPRKRNPAAEPVAQGLFLNPANRVQSLLFDKRVFTSGSAAAWARAHGYLAGPIDRGSATAARLRIRQHDPDAYRAASLRTIDLAPGVQAVVGTPR